MHHYLRCKKFLFYKYRWEGYGDKSLRLKLPKDIFIPDGVDMSKWKVRTFEWQDNCPIPEDEIFMRLPK